MANIYILSFNRDSPTLELNQYFINCLWDIDWT